MSSKVTPKNIATRAVRAGLESDAHHGSVVPPIYLSTNFAFRKLSAAAQVRLHAFRQSDARPTGRRAGGSGRRCGRNCHVHRIGRHHPDLGNAPGRGARARTLRLLRRHLPPARGAACEGKSCRGFRRSRRPGCSCARRSRAQPKLVWIETPSNPLLRVVDIRAIADAAHAAGALAAVDNTFLSPIWQQPLSLGADLRDALHHQVPERPQRCGRRRGDRSDAGAASVPGMVGQRHRRNRRAVRQFSDAARRAQPACADARACREHRVRGASF